jgi:soluble lytic murein transglycosylase-like protein
MWQESDFRNCAVSAKGALGLMQLLPSTADGLGVKDPFDPEANVLGGARLLRQLMDRYGGDLSLTLSAYNAGSAKVDATMGVPMIPETLNYVNRILSRLSFLHLSQPAAEQESTALDDQSARDSASDTSLRLIGSDDGE